MFDEPIASRDRRAAAARHGHAAERRRRAPARAADSLRTLAEATDGLAIVDTNDLAARHEARRRRSELVYLLGYYSTGKLDGRFHAITVRVKRPGVQVRARRGYLAATPAALAATSRAPLRHPRTGGRARSRRAHAVEAAIAPARRLHARRAAAAADGRRLEAGRHRVGGALGGRRARRRRDVGDAWNDGFDATVTLTTHRRRDGRRAAAISVPRGARTFRVAITPSQPLARRGVRAAGRRAGRPGVDSVARNGASGDSRRAGDRPAPSSSAAAPSTGNREVPTADLRFRRSEQIRVEIPAARAAIGDRALARSHRQAARGSGDSRGARRCRRIALGDSATRPRAAGAGRLRDRD